MLKLKSNSCGFYCNEQITKKRKENKNQGLFYRLHKSFSLFYYQYREKWSPTKVYYPEIFKTWSNMKIHVLKFFKY